MIGKDFTSLFYRMYVIFKISWNAVRMDAAFVECQVLLTIFNQKMMTQTPASLCVVLSADWIKIALKDLSVNNVCSNSFIQASFSSLKFSFGMLVYCGGVSAFFEESDKEMDSSEESDADGTGCWEKAVGFNVLMSIILTLSTLWFLNLGNWINLKQRIGKFFFPSCITLELGYGIWKFRKKAHVYSVSIPLIFYPQLNLYKMLWNCS